MVLFVLTALAFLGLLIALTVHSRKRAAALLEQNTYGDAAGMDRESFADHYRPMTQILDPRELEACRSLRGLASADFARFRASRISAFQSYLQEMRLDFNRIEFKLRYLMLAASEDEAKLVTTLNRTRTRFQFLLLRVEVQLFLFRFGWSDIEVQPLVELLDQLEGSLIRRPIASSLVAI